MPIKIGFTSFEGQSQIQDYTPLCNKVMENQKNENDS